MNIIDFPIERINGFLSDHSFVVTKPFGENVTDGNLVVKVKLTGIKPMITFGDWKNHIEYTLVLEEVDDPFLQSILNYVFASVKTLDYAISNTDTKFYSLTSQVNQLLRDFLKYFGIDYYVTCTRIIDKVTNIDPKYMTESVITENKYSNVVRQVVKDILRVFKHQKEGMPTVNSYAFSKNNRRIGALQHSVDQGIKDFDLYFKTSFKSAYMRNLLTNITRNINNNG
jgi:DNA-binding protein Fis